MANQEHLDLLKQGVKVWNQWRREHPDIQPDLSDADLRGTFLFGADLSKAYLYGADLSKAYLGRANLSGANLRGANLYGADLYSDDLTRANLSDTDLREANLYRADLSGANLGKAILTEAILSMAILSGTYLYGTTLKGANLGGANLKGAILVKTKLPKATLTNCRVYGTAVWDVDVTEADQSNLIITDPDSEEPIIRVDDLEVAQFIYLLLNHKKLRNVINAVTEHGVLLLGRFGGGGLEVLQAIAVRLREAKYLPIIFDFDRPHDRDYTETVKTLAGLSRFIIADLSGPSVPQELYATVPHFAIPVVPIIEKGRKSYAMFVDLFKHSWVVRPPVTFASTEELLSLVPSKIIAPAEEKHQERQRMLDELFRPS